MGERMRFDYYYGVEAEQFSFYRVPRLLIKDERFKGLSSDAKLLYGLMLDRMSMSIKNGWFDELNRAYIIYTIDNIKDDLGCGKEKAVKVIAELDDNKGIGLIEKVRRGLGKPDIIYVKNFVIVEDIKNESANADKYTEVGKSDFKKSENQTSRIPKIGSQEVGKADSQRSENQTSRIPKIGNQEVGKPDSNYNNTIYNNQNHTDQNYINLINQSGNESSQSTIDMIDNTNAYIELIKENIEYDHFMKYGEWQDKGLYQELFEVICDIVCVERSTVKIEGENYPYNLVKSKFLKLTSDHLTYVIRCMHENTNKISNIKAYMVTALYNAPSTINHYYEKEVLHDLYGGG